MNCKICGKEFHPRNTQLKNGQGRFCSLKCFGSYNSQNRIGEDNYNWRGGPALSNCLICGKEFKIPHYKIKKGKAKFCSYECMGVWRKQNKGGQNHPNWKGGKIKIICKKCGKEFFKKPSSLKKVGNYCSRKCKGDAMSIYQAGENSVFWKGGIHPDNLRIRSSKRYTEWRNQVFKRDNFTCQKCGDKSGGNLNAHHLKKFSFILDDIKQKFPLLPIINIAENYTDLWDIKNGITLCEKCHMSNHGKKQNFHLSSAKNN